VNRCLPIMLLALVATSIPSWSRAAPLNPAARAWRECFTSPRLQGGEKLTGLTWAVGVGYAVVTSRPRREWSAVTS
jgi:hypothetical protein